MELATIKLEVPKEMLRFLKHEDDDLRNAMMIYPAIWNGDITQGKAAEIIGMNKLDMMDLYDQLGLPYINLTRESLHEEIENLRTYWKRRDDLDRAKEA